MFGVSRKKAKPKQQVRAATATADADDDDDDDVDGAQHRAQQILQLRQNKKKKKKVKGEKIKTKSSVSMLSFDPDEGMNDDEELPMDRKKRRKKESKQQKRGGGLGYGGINAQSDGSSSEGEDKITTNDNEVGGHHARVGSLYDKSALEKLRREQKRSTLVQDDGNASMPADSVLDEGTIPPMKEDYEDNTEEAFIPLPTGKCKRHYDNSSYNQDEVVLTGDEAMAFAQREEDANNEVEFDLGLQSPPTPPPSTSTSSGGIATKKTMTGKGMNLDMNFDMMDTDEQPTEDEEEEGNRQWEDTMVRRAGVLPPKAASTDEDGSSRRTQRLEHTHQTTLGQIRASLQPTISNLGNVFTDLESSISRHETTIHSTREEMLQNQSILEKHGKALEYYQKLREDLATWIGALRELNGMVTKLEEARRLVEAEMTIRRVERFVEWGNDCIEVLEKQGLLANTSIRAKIIQNMEDSQAMSSVDEFGRDLSSLSSIARIKRWNQRRKRNLDRLRDSDVLHESQNKLEQSIACSNVDNIDSAEIGEWNQRRAVLVQALAIIPELVKEDYLSISNLCTIFFDWKRMQPEDYNSCYAEMTLVQLIEVLVRLEFCERWDVLNLHSDLLSDQCLEISEFKWFRAIIKRSLQGGESDKDTTLIVSEVIEKQIIGRIVNTFGMKGDTKQCGIYDPFSETQTKSLCTMVESLLGYFKNCPIGEHSRCEQTIEKLMDALMILLRFVVEKLGVPIVDASKINMVRNEFATRDISNGFDNETRDAIAYATVIQASELCTLVKNILGHWYPTFKHELCIRHDGLAALVRYVLEDIVSIRLLPALHSLHSLTSGGSENDEKYMVMSKTFIDDIVDTIDNKASLDPAEWMLTLAPLRVTVKQWG